MHQYVKNDAIHKTIEHNIFIYLRYFMFRQRRLNTGISRIKMRSVE